jgi:hypothetical protein
MSAAFEQSAFERAAFEQSPFEQAAFERRLMFEPAPRLPLCKTPLRRHTRGRISDNALPQITLLSPVRDRA